MQSAGEPAPPSHTSAFPFKNPSAAAPLASAPGSASFSLPPACSPGRLPVDSGSPAARARPLAPPPAHTHLTPLGTSPRRRPGRPPPLPHAPAGPQRPCRRPGAARRTHIGSSNLASQDLRASTSSMSMVQGRRARPPLLQGPAAGLRSPPPHAPSQLRVP